MKTLRAKFALLLIVAIVAVVALITLAMIYVFAVPKDAKVDLFARQLVLMKELAGPNPADAGLASRPAPGRPDTQQAELIRTAARRLGASLDVTVTHTDDDRRLRQVSLRVAPDRWIVLQIDSLSDRELWIWLALIMLGVGSIAVLAADRMSRPLMLLESAVESVGPDGVLPELAESGPAEVRATAAAINSLSARLNRAIESRMRLVAAAGHDLRTPLTRMRLRAEFVADEEDRDLWLKDIDELQRIAHSAIQLVHEESTRNPPEVIRLDELVANIVTELQQQDVAIELGATSEVHVRTSRLPLNRALRNLFINAGTHGMGGTVTVTVGHRARITISDRGPGIAPDSLDQVFEPFFRAERTRSQNIPGAGLGLTISREIILRADGDITIANRSEGGLVQTVDLPSVQAASVVAPQPAAE